MTGRHYLPDGSVVRRLAAGLGLAFLAAAVVGLSAARDPEPGKAGAPAAKAGRPPEEEDPDSRPVKTHKVSVDDPDDAGPKAPAAPRAVDLIQAAKDAKHPDIKKLFQNLAVPHDVVHSEAFIKAPKQNIVPYPDYVGNRDAVPEPFMVTPFQPNSWAPADAPVTLKHGTVVSVEPYEQLALDAVAEFLGANYANTADPAPHLSRYDQDVAAEQALTAVLLFHQSAKERGGRKGDAWAPLEDALKQKLLGVTLEELKLLTEENNWDAAFALTKRLAETYKGEEDRERIAAPLTGLVKKTLVAGSLNEAQKEQARLRFRQLEDLFPRSRVIEPVTEALHEQAKSLFEEAQAQQDKNPEHAAKLLNEAEEAWPAMPGLRARRLEMSKEHPTLRVGVRELPARVSPALAVSDSDLRAEELVFESLMKLSPDGAGGCRWVPALAEGRPRLTPGGRQFRLPESACWSDGDMLRAGDFRSTVELLKKGRLSRRPPVWADLLDDVSVSDPTAVDLTLKQGWLDPLALMNFKVLPPKADPASPAFAAHPVGSGPFVYGGTATRDDHTCAFFTTNPYYGARAGKAGLPHIQEIRFFAYKDSVAEAPRFDLILDLTAKEAASLRAKASELRLRFPPAAAPNRRIYFLAVNNRQPALANAAFRCALARAINRDRLLDDDFRANPGQDLHTALNGPYPAKSWASKSSLIPKHGDKATEDPFDPAQAKAKLAEAGAREIPTLSLKYPAGDPAVAAAMRGLAAQAKEALGVTLAPEAESEVDLRKDVEETHSYALAYYHYDFPDDVYWLGPLLDPRAGADGQNYLGYKGGLVTLIHDESRRRDFAEVRERAHVLHDRFLNEEMPFIPLWQLDPIAAVHADVVAPPFDPLLVFTDAEQWRLERK